MLLNVRITLGALKNPKCTGYSLYQSYKSLWHRIHALVIFESLVIQCRARFDNLSDSLLPYHPDTSQTSRHTQVNKALQGLSSAFLASSKCCWSRDHTLNSELMGLPRWLSGKESACQRRRCGWVGKIPGEGNGNPLLYFCLGNPMDRGARWATVHGVAKELDMTE